MLNKYTIIGTLKAIDSPIKMDNYIAKITIEVNKDSIIMLVSRDVDISELVCDSLVGVIGEIKAFDTAMVPVVERLEVIEGSDD